MSKQQNWLMIDMHTHSQYSAMRKSGERVKEMPPNDFVETLYQYGIKIFSITDHNYFSDEYYDKIDEYISSQKYEIRIVNGVELDIYVDIEKQPNAFIHVCFYFEDKVNRKELHNSVETLYANGNKPNFKAVLSEFSKLSSKIVTIPHGNKDKGLLNKYLIDNIVSEDRKEFYKYAMYKVFNAFDITPSSINDSENHWALNFYEKTQSFKNLVIDKTEEEIANIRRHIVDYLKGINIELTNEEKIIFDYAKKYGSFYAYFAFSDWHNAFDYKPEINNFIFGCTDFAFNSFELATLDPISRIEKTKDKSIEISDSLISEIGFKINGKNKTIHFSPGLNAIVGKRGSGKSLLVSVIRNLVKSDDPDGAIKKYKGLNISDITCVNRGGISLSLGRLSSTEFLKQDEIRDIIDNPSNAQDKIKNKFPSIKDIDLSELEKIAVLCDQITPYEKDYKSLTSEISSVSLKNSYIYKTIEPFESTIVEANFSIVISKLKEIKNDLKIHHYQLTSIDELIDRAESIKQNYILQIELINEIIDKHNKDIASFNKVLSLNQDNARRNVENIGAAFKLIDGNLNRALTFKILKAKLSDVAIDIHPASISLEGKYLFANYYELKTNLKETLIRSITNSITYASDDLETEVGKFLNGDEKRKLKNNVNKLGDGIRELIKSDYFKSKKAFYEISNQSIDYKASIKTSDAIDKCVKSGDLIDLNSASLGVKSVAYLNMLFDLEDKILVFDQPEDNIDNDYISNHLVPIIKSNKRIKQLIFVTHNPSVAVYGDAFNYIYTQNEDEIMYENYFIEDIEDKEKLLKILEGGRTSFSNRNKKYGDILGDENYGS